MTEEAPYLQIAAEYRRRIAAGELVPGDRLPSTRALATEWGVAPGTAAKALAELTRSGAVRTQERAGSVVASRRTPDGTRPPLARAAIVAAAVAIADAEGLDAVSMRSVGSRLQVAPMSIYRHVENKDALLLLMADRVYGESRYPDRLPPTWRARLELVARTLWRLYRAHPWLTQLAPLSRPLPLPQLLRHGDVIVGALDGLGLSPGRVLDLQIVLFAHGQGLAANLEREASVRGTTGVTDQQWEADQVPTVRAIAGRDDLTHLAGLIDALAPGYDFDLDVLFETGLQALLDGFTVLIRREGTGVRRGR